MHNSFRQIMILLKMLREKGQKEIDDFINEHGENHERVEKTVTFNLKIDKRSEFQKLASKVKSTTSATKLIPRNFIVALVCAYDSFLGKVLRFILESKPEILDASERTLKFSELQSFSDINSAREYLVEKEVESVLRKSHTEQFSWLEKKLGTSFNKGLKNWPVFVELTERRNLFVHCDGVVSSQYLTVCKENKCNFENGIGVGTSLGVPSKYFESAYKCLYEVGVKLAHVIWRKLLKSEIDQIDENITISTFHLIENDDFEIAIEILEFFTQKQIDHFNESNERVMVINLAQAYKWLGDEQKCKEILDSRDWSASEDRFKLCTSVLKDDFESAYKLMRQLSHDETFHKVYYKEWPIFQKLRQEAKFVATYEECYKESFVTVQKVVSKTKDNTESVDQKPVDVVAEK